MQLLKIWHGNDNTVGVVALNCVWQLTIIFVGDAYIPTRNHIYASEPFLFVMENEIIYLSIEFVTISYFKLHVGGLFKHENRSEIKWFNSCLNG